MHSPILAIVETSAIRSSHAGTVSKRRKLGSQNLHQQIAQGRKFWKHKVNPENRKGSPRVRVLNQSWVGQIGVFQEMKSLYLRNGVR